MSLDGPEKHKAFAESLHLNFPLISDRDQKLASAFGVTRLWGLLPFTKRVTFVVDGEGTIRRVIAAEFDIDRHINEAITGVRS